MDKELPATIWVPALVAAVLIPFVAFYGHAVLGVLGAFGVWGLGGYLAFKALGTNQKGRAIVYVIGAVFVSRLILGATIPPPTQEDLAIQAKAQAVEDNSDYIDSIGVHHYPKQKQREMEASDISARSFCDPYVDRLVGTGAIAARDKDQAWHQCMASHGGAPWSLR
jgi:hypothetical protein